MAAAAGEAAFRGIVAHANAANAARAKEMQSSTAEQLKAELKRRGTFCDGCGDNKEPVVAECKGGCGDMVCAACVPTRLNAGGVCYVCVDGDDDAMMGAFEAHMQAIAERAAPAKKGGP